MSSSNTDNKYLYQGKESQDDFGLNWYDYGARMYNPALGLWHTLDAQANDENQIDKTPYEYA